MAILNIPGYSYPEGLSVAGIQLSSNVTQEGRLRITLAPVEDNDNTG